MTKYRPPLQSRDPLLVRQVLEGEAQQHGLAVEMARKYSGFTDEQAIHAFAATISIKASQVLNSPDLEPNLSSWMPHNEPLENIADLHHYARYSHLHPMLAFVGLVCLYYDLESQRVKDVLKEKFSNGAEFNAVRDYVVLADTIAGLAAMKQKGFGAE